MEGFGMFTGGGAAVALTGVRITATLTGAGQRTLVEQVFINREAAAIEAVYTFPLPDGAAVCGFEAITGERVLTGVIEELETGLEKYETAVREGDGAFLAEMWRPDVFSTRIGNLKPGQAVRIRLTYVAEVAVADRTLRVSFPLTIAPRYGTATGMDVVTAAVESDALNPPHVLSVPYGVEFFATLDVGARIRTVGSPSHGVTVEAAEGTAPWKVRLTGNGSLMNRDLVLEVELAHEPAASARLEPGLAPDEHFVALDFVPTFAEDEVVQSNGPREIVFVLDCSGSMEGPSIEQARRALALCLKSLSEGDRFNICRFGSTHEWMTESAQTYGQETLDRALAYLDRAGADLGGTELFSPLEEAMTFSGKQVREIIVLTDGQVSNEPAIVALARKRRGRVRLFTFGIGSAPSAYLINGLARATGGASEFIASGERIEEKVLRTFARMNSPRLEEVSVRFDAGDAALAPREVPALFDGDFASVTARVVARTPPHTVTVSGILGGKPQTWKVPIFASPVAASGVGPIAARWTRSRIADLEAEGVDAERKASIVGLSKRYSVLCKETTLLAVEHRSEAERTSGMPALRRVPVMLAEGWGGAAAVNACSIAPGCAPAPVAGGGGWHKVGEVRESWSKSALPPAPPASSPAFSIEPMDAKKVRGYPRRKSEPAKPSTERAGAAPRDPLMELLMSQTAAGNFADHALLHGTSVVGVPFDGKALGEELAAAGVTGEAATTALVLACFLACFADRKHLWGAAYNKALRWLDKHAPAASAWVRARSVPVKP
jgi:Ca-activated chloride channel family protein